jgi:hypothetical protein
MSVLVEAATATAVEMHAGVPIAATSPSLPAEMTVKTPAFLSRSIAGFCGSVSHVPGKAPPPRLMFTDASLTPPGRLFMLAKT